jgi:microcystin-dependent protein
MAQPFVGQIMLCPYSFPPVGWMDCAGQLLPISQFNALFSLLGVAYGGNGTSNFGLPDLQGRATVSQGALIATNYVMGEEAGAESVTLSTSEMAIHQHTMRADGGPANAFTTAGNMLARPSKLTSGGLYAAPPAPPDTTTPLSPLAVGVAGESAGHNTMQPFLVLRYIIATQGIFPPRS